MLNGAADACRAATALAVLEAHDGKMIGSAVAVVVAMAVAVVAAALADPGAKAVVVAAVPVATVAVAGTVADLVNLFSFEPNPTGCVCVRFRLEVWVAAETFELTETVLFEGLPTLVACSEFDLSSLVGT